jgi:hypothetical protein
LVCVTGADYVAEAIEGGERAKKEYSAVPATAINEIGKGSEI